MIFRFSPDVIGADASYCLVMQLIEIGVLAACLYVLNSSISFLDLVSFSGYKYIPLVINTIVYQLLGTFAYYIALLYTGIAVSYFTVRFVTVAFETNIFSAINQFGVTAQLHEGQRDGTHTREPYFSELLALRVRPLLLTSCIG